MASNFERFLAFFPIAKLPLSLTEEQARIFSQENKPLPERLILEHIQPYERDYDELTEYVPCFRIGNVKDFHAIVYWRGGLMNYQYIMLTYEKGGKLIDRRVLAGTFSDGVVITRSIARLDDDMSITIMSGQMSEKENLYKAANSTTIDLEILPNGKVIELV